MAIATQPRPVSPPAVSAPSGAWFGPWIWPLAALLVPLQVRVLVPLIPGLAAGDWAFQCGRIAGYLAAASLFVPYLYALRRTMRKRRWGNASRWIFWHIFFASLAFGTALVHIDFRLSKPFGALTVWIMLLFALVMMSGVLGMIGQKVLYRLLERLSSEELGRPGLERERERIAARAKRLIEGYSLLTPGDVRDWDGFCYRLQTERYFEPNVRRFMPQRAYRALLAVLHGKQTPEAEREVLAAVNEFLSDDKFFRAANLTGYIVEVEGRLAGPSPGTVEEQQRWQRWLEAARALQSEAAGVPDQPGNARGVERLNRVCLEYLLKATLQESAPPSQTVQRFFAEAVEPELAAPFSFWPWLLAGRRRSPLAANYYQRVKALAAPAHQGMLDQLWFWLQRRREMDLEYRLHRIARHWVGFHTLAAWLLFVLVADHVLASLRFGGY